MNITIVAGARPNFMKIAPITKVIDTARRQGKEISYQLVYTGTPEDDSIDISLFSDLNMQAPDAYLYIKEKNPVRSVARLMMAFDDYLTKHPTQVVLVVDDLTPTMACTLVAKKHRLKVAHISAGTRSFDINMPKELNNIIIDGLSDYLFVAGMAANRNLNQSGMQSNNIYHVGNILIDTLRHNRGRLIRPLWFSTFGLEEKNYLLLTINRHALLSNRQNLRALIETAVREAGNRPIVAPLHSYVRDAVRSLNIKADNLHILPTQSYLAFGYLLDKAFGVITDSGNIAEEATFLGIPCITLNTYAEHPETVQTGTNELVGEDPARLSEAMQALMSGRWKQGNLPEKWDGRTAERIVQMLIETV